MSMKIRCALFLFIALSALARANSDIQISADYPGGNIIVESIDQASSTVNLRQDLRGTKPWWFYWNFKAKNIGGKKVTFKFPNKPKDENIIEVFGPAVSTDGGKTWRWLNPPEPRKKNEFVYEAPDGVNEAQFSFCIPYTMENFNAFAKEMRNDAFVIKPLCKTKRGRENICVVINENPSKRKARVFLTSRHHACEATGSYVLEGVMREILSDSPTGRALRQKAEFFIIPIVDLDGVEDGDQGKLRVPHDHNRDYSDNPIYPTVAAARAKLLEWNNTGGIDFLMDFHAPYIGAKSKDGKTFSINSVIYPVGQAVPRIFEAQKRFAKILEKVNDSPLPFLASDLLPYGKLWNVRKTNTHITGYSALLNGTKFSSSLEIPYSSCRGVQTSPESLKAFGSCVAKAMLEYLNTQSEH